MNEQLPEESSEPDWKFELTDPGTAVPPQIALNEIDLVTTAWGQIQSQRMTLGKTCAEFDGLIQGWKAQGFSVDQIAVAARLPIDTVKASLNSGVIAYLQERD